MFQCHVCGNKTFRDEFVSEIFNVDGWRVLVEHIPAKVCERCDEAEISPNTAEQIRQLVHEQGQPQETVTVDVFSIS